MVYDNSHLVEQIAVRPNDSLKETHFIELTRIGNDPVFFVTCSFYDKDYSWEFETFSISDYERVKFNILNAVFECDTMYELMDMLDEIFTDGFSDILVDYTNECEIKCCGDCASCTCESTENNNKNLN